MDVGDGARPAGPSGRDGPDMDAFLASQHGIATHVPRYDRGALDRRVLILGVGGNGCHVSQALVRMGVRDLTIVEFDVVEARNLTRQLLYAPADLGRPKVEVAAAELRRQSFRTSIEAIGMDVLAERPRAAELIATHDFTFALMDTEGARFFATSRAWELGKPLVSGGTEATSGIFAEAVAQLPGDNPCDECMCPRTRPVPSDEWYAYYRSADVAAEKPGSVEETDKALADQLPDACASMYPTAAIGSNLMVLAWLRWAIGVKGDLFWQMNVMNGFLKHGTPRVRRGCRLCGR